MMKIVGVLLITFSVNVFALESDSIDKEAVRRLIRVNLSRFKACYTEELNHNSQLEGKVVLNWDITEVGIVKAAEVSSSTLKNAKAEECMIAVLKSIKFPEPPKGTVTNLNFPFIFGHKK